MRYKKAYYIWTMFVAAMLVYVLVFHHDVVSGPLFLSKKFSLEEWGELLRQYQEQEDISGLRNIIEGINEINTFVIIAVYFIVFKKRKSIITKKKVKMIFASVISLVVAVALVRSNSFRLCLSIAAMFQFNLCQCYMLGMIDYD